MSPQRPAFKLIASLLCFLQIWVGWPAVILIALSPAHAVDPVSAVEAEALAAAQVEPVLGRDEGIADTSVAFSNDPSDEEIQLARVFPEPLIPVGSVVVDGENVAIAEALAQYAGQADRADISALKSFLEKYPTSRWSPALQTNVALLLRNSGFFTSSMEMFETVWNTAKSDETQVGQSLADRALGELADLNARFGRFNRLEELFTEADSRDITGRAQNLISHARQGHWIMTNKPSEGFRCGPYAVNAVMNSQDGTETIDPVIAKEPSTQQGTSLDQLQKLSQRAGREMIPAKRAPGAAWAVPMVVHWKVGHFAAITRTYKGKFLVEDPTFGGELWVTAEALEAEATGFGLVPNQDGRLPAGWSAISAEEASKIWGKGGSEGSDPNATSCENEKTSCSSGTGMATHGIFKMLATLHLTDAPVGYNPPFGRPVHFRASYTHLEAGQPQNFNFTNLGAFWVNNWVSYAEVDTSGNVIVRLRNGGSESFPFSGYNPLTSEFDSSIYSAAVLRKKSANRYERQLPDGTRELYSQTDGSTGRIFLKQIIDPQGNATTLNYDSNLRLTTIVDGLNQATTITYKSNSGSNAGFYKIYRVTDPFGRYAEFTYDSGLTRLEKIRDVIGIESSFVYGSDGFISRLTTPYGNTDFYQYIPVPIGDGMGRGLLVFLPDGSREVMESYRGHTMMTYYWSRKAMAMAPGDRSMAEQTRWLMSQEGNIMKDVPDWRKQAFEAPVYFTYPAQGDPTESPDPNDPPGTLHRHVGALRHPDTITQALAGGGEQVSRFEYNKLGNVTEHTDPIGRKFEFKYAVNNVDLLEVRQIRNGANQLLKKTIFDKRHLPLKMIAASGRETNFTYNSRGQVLTITNPRNEVTTYTYNANGYLTKIDGSLAGDLDRTEAGYDSFGRLRTITQVEGPGAANAWTVTMDYDALNRPTKTTYPDTTTEETVYSRLDPIRSKDRLGRWTTRIYDALGQKVEERDPQGRLFKYEWCRCGALQKLTDPKGQVTHWSYDAQARLTKKTYPDNSEEIYTYEPVTTSGRLLSVTDPAGNVATYGYHADDSIASITRSAASGFAPVAPVTVSWDPDFRRVSTVSDTYGQYTYAYTPYANDSYGTPQNGRGQLENISFDTLNTTIAYEYDELGRIANRQIDGNSNESSWNYDAAGRLSSWTNALGTFTPTYVNAAYGVERMESLAFPSGQTVNYDWGTNVEDFRLKEIEHLGPGTTALLKFGYVTDAISRISQWKKQRGTEPMERFELGYNRSDELTSAVLRDDSTNAILKQFFYSYDPAANRTSEQIDTAVTSGTFNSLNQLTDISAGGKTRFQGTLNEPGTVTAGGQPAWMQGGTNFVADVSLTSGTNSIAVVAKDANNNTKTNTYQVIVPGGTGKSLSYDLAGNTISDGTHTFTWDAASRLVKITYGDNATSEFGYDAFGRRVKIVEKDSAGNATSTKQFVFDGLAIAEQRDGDNVLTTRYFQDGYVIGANATPAVDQQFYYLRDHLGSIRGVFNRDEQAIEVYQDFDPYGRMTLTDGTNNTASDMSYTGHYRHSKSGMYLTMYRAYSPELARWLSRDPIGEVGGINLYAYVANNPVNYFDPMGAFSWPSVVGVVGGIVSVALFPTYPVVAIGIGVVAAGFLIYDLYDTCNTRQQLEDIVTDTTKNYFDTINELSQPGSENLPDPLNSSSGSQ